MPHALVVEDHLGMQLLYQSVLTDWGFSVTVAGTLAQAKSLWRLRRPDVVLLDVALPDGTGSELLDDLEGTSVPVVIVSAYEGTPHATLAPGRIAARLAKPFNLEDLRRTLKDLSSPAGAGSQEAP